MEKDFKHIIDEYNGILYKIARSFTLGEADFKDLYQEMLIQLWQSYGRFRGESKISTWIYRVVLNTALTFQKKQKRQQSNNPIDNISFKIPDQGRAGVEQVFEKEKKIELLYKCINHLGKDERAIILLHLDEKKYDEIAEILGLTTSHVGVKLLRIKKQLFKLLNEQGYGRI
ncbi:MAG: RNA polymerase sigma factor [Saprospiraceae bacterium]